jgi:hypothetical protein
MLNQHRLFARRAIESLRLGVPTASSVTALPPFQPEIIEEAQRLRRGRGSTGRNGMLLEGDFGSGKSHLMTYLLAEARDDGFATSYVSVSKETPLHRLDLVYGAAIASISYPDERMSGTLTGALEALDRNSAEYAHLRRSLSERLPITSSVIELFVKSRHNAEVMQFVVDFWDGAPLSIYDFRRYARGIIPDIQMLRRPPSSELALGRFETAAALLMAAGCRGWLIVLDELELIAKFTTLSRMKSYATIGSLFNRAPEVFPRFIGGLTPDFRSEVFENRDDLSRIPEFEHRLPSPFSVANGTDFINAPANRFRLRSLDLAHLRDAATSILEVYRVAFAIDSLSEIKDQDLQPGQRLRTLVRKWITHWDIELLYQRSAEIQTRQLEPDLSEDEAFDERTA